MFDTDGFRYVFDRLLYRYDVHAKSAASLRNESGNFSYRYAGSIVEECSYFRMIFQKPGRHHHVFSGTDDPFRDEILTAVFRILTVEFHETDLTDIHCHFLCFFRCHVVAFCHLFRQKLYDSLLLERQHETYLLFSQQAVQDPEIREMYINIFRAVDLDVIGDQISKLLHQLFFFGISADIVLIEKIPFIEHVIL